MLLPALHAGTITEDCSLYDRTGNFISKACVDPDGDGVYYGSGTFARVSMGNWVVSASGTLSFDIPRDEPTSAPYQFSVSLDDYATDQTTILLPGSGSGYLEYFVESDGPTGEEAGGIFLPSLDAPCSNLGLCLVPFTYGVPFTLSVTADITFQAPKSNYALLDEEDYDLFGHLVAILPAPEPSSFFMVAAALVGFVLIGRRRT